MNNLKEKLKGITEKLPFNLPIHVWIALLCVLVLAVGFGIYSAATGNSSSSAVKNIADTVIPEEKHDYSEAEQLLYNNVKTYLTDMLDNREKENAKVAEDAVTNFNVIVNSGATQITQEKYEAVNYKEYHRGIGVTYF